MILSRKLFQVSQVLFSQRDEMTYDDGATNIAASQFDLGNSPGAG
jgi:hypothetical protein